MEEKSNTGAVKDSRRGVGGRKKRPYGLCKHQGWGNSADSNASGLKGKKGHTTTQTSIQPGVRVGSIGKVSGGGLED